VTYLANRTSIAWADWSVNTGRGCEHASRGCFRCYSERDDNRWARDFTVVRKQPSGFQALLKLSRKVAREGGPGRVDKVFVNSMTDTWHEFFEDEYVARHFALAAVTPNLIYQMPTKRHARMRAMLRNEDRMRELMVRSVDPANPDRIVNLSPAQLKMVEDAPWPLPNVWPAVSVEDQYWAERRIPALLETPAAVRWISAEPLLGPIDLENLRVRNRLIDCLGGDVKDPRDGAVITGTPAVLDMVVVGGESGTVNPVDPWDAPDIPEEGQKAYARGMRIEWAADLAAQTKRHGRAAFMKQFGSVQAHLLGLADTKGEKWDQWPAALEHLKIREFPERIG
jgi:protein gp37